MDVSLVSQVHESGMAAKDNLDSLVANSIGRLIFEAGLEPDFFHLPSFEGVSNLLTREVQIAMPTYESILQVQLGELQQRGRALKQLWGKNGCSLILYKWSGQCEKTFFSAFVHHKEGMLFLRSMDISDIKDDVDELASAVCVVIDDIGVQNIVQVITNDASPYMQAVEHAVLKTHDHSFSFTLCADYCFNLLLKKIEALDHVNKVLMKASHITRFLYSHELPMKMKGKYIPGGEIISNCPLNYVAMFVTLQNLVSHRENLKKMFSSSEWTSSDLASTNLSKQICEIIQSGEAFWCAAASVLKVTGPIISVLLKLETDNCPMGVLYDAIDSAKEEIKQNITNEHGSYWKLIDFIWDNYLHSPIHAAGYFLNPKIFYSSMYPHDEEISTGMATCIVQATKTNDDALYMAGQFDLYQSKSGLFGSDTAAQEALEIPQVAWWLKYGTGTSELQSFAQRILSQTCFGATRYNLDKSISERLHTEARSRTDEERFRNMEYIYYNLHLRNSVPCLHGPSEGKHGKLTTKLGDWISTKHTPGGSRQQPKCL